MEFAAVEGTVTHNGRPAANIEVAFFADLDTRGPRASGLTDDAGRYRLVTEAGQEGAVVGNHRVCLLDQDPSMTPTANLSLAVAMAGKTSPETTARLKDELARRRAGGKSGSAASRVPEAYCRPWETPLRATVRAGSQTIDFQIP
jgi:hypothetical protein